MITKMLVWSNTGNWEADQMGLLKHFQVDGRNVNRDILAILAEEHNVVADSPHDLNVRFNTHDVSEILDEYKLDVMCELNLDFVFVYEDNVYAVVYIC